MAKCVNYDDLIYVIYECMIMLKVSLKMMTTDQQTWGLIMMSKWASNGRLTSLWNKLNIAHVFLSEFAMTIPMSREEKM